MLIQYIKRGEGERKKGRQRGREKDV